MEPGNRDLPDAPRGAPVNPALASSRPPRKARHLIDPTAPRPVRDRQAAAKSLTRVQRWVMSALLLTTVLHLCAGLTLAAIFLSEPTRTAEIGLNVISAAFATVALAAVLLIHGKRPISPWLLCGLVPGIIGAWITLSVR